MRDFPMSRPGDGPRLTMISEHASPLGALGGADGGGQNVYVGQVARHLVRHGWSVEVLTRRDDPDLPEVTEWLDGVRVVHVPAGPAAPIPKEDLLGLMPAFAAWTEAHCRDSRPDLIHANFFLSGLVAADVSAATGIPFAITFHALGRVRRQAQGSADRFPPEREAIEERVAREAALVIAECPQDRRDLVTLYRADPQRIREVPCGVDLDEFAAVPRDTARAILGLPADGFLALQLGRMVPRKGVDDAIRAVARCRRAGATDMRLAVVGGASPILNASTDAEYARLRGVAADEGVADAVNFAGSRPRDLLRYYFHAADAFLTLPWYEPFGITPLEAMACGIPVIGAAVGGIAHSVVDGETGILVPPRDPGAAADALGRLHADPALRARMGQAGRRRVADRFTWNSVADGLDTAFRDLLQRPARQCPPQARTVPNHRADGFDELARLLSAHRGILALQTARLAAEVTDVLSNGGKLLVCGNGGSAADAQHMVAELVGRFLVPGRRALPAIALGCCAATMTAWSNDFSYEDALAREVLALGRPGDAILAFSTSGQSRNLIAAFDAAGKAGLRRLALLGRDGGPLLAQCDRAVVVPSNSTPRIQEVHTLMMHEICAAVETDARIAPVADRPPMRPAMRDAGAAAYPRFVT
ncbi:hypothetical protein OCGS_2181 [Oceaniovalibus guishaninsula JLT2003]|uniref:SIS domain-containing protein n=1 Tax=Oceaniovalibus guishaninsula JLT2003 TaxID=1231392 RepID=K2HAZ7_9RHOB|nr:glycosyltransferase [Oceaniovalibus guishaninsula]EKE43847.1 hypothetical protein OCGS_2181 [Oceaniovalibus guishaninsula JLT2003]